MGHLGSEDGKISNDDIPTNFHFSMAQMSAHGLNIILFWEKFDMGLLRRWPLSDNEGELGLMRPFRHRNRLIYFAWRPLIGQFGPFANFEEKTLKLFGFICQKVPNIFLQYILYFWVNIYYKFFWSSWNNWRLIGVIIFSVKNFHFHFMKIDLPGKEKIPFRKSIWCWRFLSEIFQIWEKQKHKIYNYWKNWERVRIQLFGNGEI